MGKRKYPEVKEGYWVYSIKIPSINKYYIGMSGRKKCYQRWQKALYENNSLGKYLDEWDSMVKTVLIDGLTKEEALIYEGKIIDALNMNGLCINEQRSGLIYINDKNAYMREYRENNTEYHEREKERNKLYKRQYRLNNKEKMREYDRQRYQKKKQQQTVVP